MDRSTGETVNVQLKRAKMLGCLANRVPCVVGIEVRGEAHSQARELTAQEHTVQLIHLPAHLAC